MRFSEAANLRIHDIDSQRMQIRITHGKGAKQRQVPLSPRLLSELREYWKAYKPTSLLFPGKTPEKTYCDTSIQKAIKASAELANINKNVTPHTLRHSYATGLLEAGVDLLTISRLLGHASFATTMIYLHCRREHLHSAPSPRDWLPVKQLPTYQPAPELEPKSQSEPQPESKPQPKSQSDACDLVQSVLAKLSLCRTPALGGKQYACDSCGHTDVVHHSCGDRHCPICSGRKRYDFAECAQRLILDGVTYYQVVFTLPSELSELALANRMEMAELLFQSAWKASRKTIRTEQGFDPAAMMVLHTWNQLLGAHWHAHALVPEGGTSLSGLEGWKGATAPDGAANSDGYHLVDAINLREMFRKFAIAHLRRLRRRGELRLGDKFSHLNDDAQWEVFCSELESVDDFNDPEFGESANSCFNGDTDFESSSPVIYSAAALLCRAASRAGLSVRIVLSRSERAVRAVDRHVDCPQGRSTKSGARSMHARPVPP